MTFLDFNIISFIKNDFVRLSPKEQVECLNNILIIVNDIKAIEELLTDLKKDLIKNTLQQRKNKSHDKPINIPKLLSIPEVSKILGCTRQTVYNKHIPNGLKVIYPTGPKGNKKVLQNELHSYILKLST